MVLDRPTEWLARAWGYFDGSDLAGNDTHRGRDESRAMFARAHGGQGRRRRAGLAAVSRKRLAKLLAVTFVLMSAVYVGAVTIGGGRIEPVIFLAMAGILGCPLVVKLLAPDLTGRRRVKPTRKGRTPFDLEDPDSRRRMREEAPRRTEDPPDHRRR